ncbi:MAG TPA: TolC family protein, partial [Holophagaceae bacterium]|nr:TolC family protein [Holophagaceae bacterium]
MKRVAFENQRLGKARGAARAGLLTAFALALAGCAVGPKFESPEAPKADRYGAAPAPAQVGDASVPGGGVQQIQPGQAVPEKWWTAFGSEELDKRVDEALAHSPSVEAARASLKQSEELLRASKGAWFPAADAAAGVSRQKQSVATGGAGTPFTL